MVIEHFKTGRRPYRILFHPDGKSFFVSSWADGTVVRTTRRRRAAAPGCAWARIRRIWSGAPAKRRMDETARRGPRVSSSPRRIPITSTRSASPNRRQTAPVETINVAHDAAAAAGHDSSALALSADGKRLYVACSDANAVAVADISGRAAQSLGFIPTGWYPTAVRALADGRSSCSTAAACAPIPNPKAARIPRSVGPSMKARAMPVRPTSAACRPARPLSSIRLDDDSWTSTQRACSPIRPIATSCFPMPASGAGSPIPQTRTRLAHRARHLHRQGKPHL